MKKIVAIIFWVILFQLIGYGIGMLSQTNIETWYQTLHKPSLNPPEIIFPIVWSCLYVMLAVAGWSLWQRKEISLGKIIIGFYAIEMIMNWLWTPLFFQFHLIQLGFYWIVMMIALTLVIILMTRQTNKLVCYLLIPYCLWLFFACYLNWAIWTNN